MQQGEKYIEKGAKVDYQKYQINNKPTLQEKQISVKRVLDELFRCVISCSFTLGDIYWRLVHTTEH